MRTFDYVTILFSIMLGVCITQMATNVVVVIQHVSDSVLYAPPILWNLAALIAILAHWVHFYKGNNRVQWNALQLTIVFITPLIYFIPATLIAQAPVVDGQLNYRTLFDANRELIYLSAIFFSLFTQAQYFFVYESHEKFIYIYYSLIIVLIGIASTVNSPLFDQVLAVGVVVSEFTHHYLIRPLRLP